mmetsp:Transcript_5403/g.17382  ORF Transcript_5403/g.17382 Transcript_5403/m.17382 type:complete len:209 (-) Transcript_5403:62-688(-)
MRGEGTGDKVSEPAGRQGEGGSGSRGHASGSWLAEEGGGGIAPATKGLMAKLTAETGCGRGGGGQLAMSEAEVKMAEGGGGGGWRKVAEAAARATAGARAAAAKAAARSGGGGEGGGRVAVARESGGQRRRGRRRGGWRRRGRGRGRRRSRWRRRGRGGRWRRELCSGALGGGASGGDRRLGMHGACIGRCASTGFQEGLSRQKSPRS